MGTARAVERMALVWALALDLYRPGWHRPIAVQYLIAFGTHFTIPHHRGIYKADIKGSDYSNPILLTSLPAEATLDIAVGSERRLRGTALAAPSCLPWGSQQG